MEIWLWIIIGILTIFLIVALMKLYLTQKSVREIGAQFAEKLTVDTNTLIDISSRNRHIGKLACEINKQLRLLREERQRFQQGDRELKEAVTNISHDLRTPLTAICGYLELLEREEKSETVERYLAMMENRIHVLKQLTEELFRYSVVTSTPEISMELVDLRHILEESLASYYGTMRQKQITPCVSIPEQKRIERYLDASAVSRIFSNIISNALKYSDGDLTITLDETGTIVFSNTAAGLSPVMVARLFDRFYTVENARNATGLGLSIAKFLTERMGGTIHAEYQNQTLSIIVMFPANA